MLRPAIDRAAMVEGLDTLPRMIIAVDNAMMVKLNITRGPSKPRSQKTINVAQPAACMAAASRRDGCHRRASMDVRQPIEMASKHAGLAYREKISLSAWAAR